MKKINELFKQFAYADVGSYTQRPAVIGQLPGSVMAMCSSFHVH